MVRKIIFLLALGLVQFALCVSAPAAGPWTPAELAGKPEERHAGRMGAPDLTPPERTVPRNVLPPLPSALRGSIRRVDTGGEKLVALTFDLCELADQATGYDGAVVDVLRSEGAPATFFAGGKWMRSHPVRAMQLLADPLFEVGSHAWTHGNFGVLDTARMREQIDWTQAQYELTRESLARLAAERGDRQTLVRLASGGDGPDNSVRRSDGLDGAENPIDPASGNVGRGGHGGQAEPAATIPGNPARIPDSIHVFRFPYGRCRAEALDMLASKGLAAIQWDVNMMDAARTRNAQAVARDVERGVKPGSIVLGHANGFGHATAEALQIIIPALRARGYRFVTVSSLLASGKAVTAPDCYDSRSGDTALYDAMFGDGTTHPRKR